MTKRLIAALLLALLFAFSGRPAEAAVAEFFWAGFQVSDPRQNAAKLSDFLYRTLDTRYRSSAKGVARKLLQGLEWDDFAYFESAAGTGYLKENMRDVFGVFLNIDRVMRFRPSLVDVAGKKQAKHYTYIFATLNVFAADTRNLVFSHPVFLTDVFDREVALEEILGTTLGKFADQLEDATNPYTLKIRERLQRYFGRPGQALEAIRRTPKPIHPIDSYFADTFGVMAPCKECVGVADKSGMVKADPVAMGDFTRFFLNTRLAETHQVAFLPEQAKLVQERTGDVAATAKEGDIKRDYSEVCLPEYDETGQSRICVRVLPPRNPVWIGVRVLVKPEPGEAELIKLRFLTVVDLETERSGRSQPVSSQLSVDYSVAAMARGQVSDVYYINALIKAVNTFDDGKLK